MPETIGNNTVTLQKRQALIRALPCFAMLLPNESHELAELMTSVHFHAGHTIVEQDVLIDSVFIIVTGQAEVMLQSSIKKRRIIRKVIKVVSVPVAVLDKGDAIGLNDTGFFSTSGRRTATIVALSDMHCLKIDLKELHHFLQLHPDLKSNMYTTAEHMLRVKLIKQSLPFSHLSHERLLWLAGQVENVFVPAGTVVFQQGDEGDRCYLVRSGAVNVVVKNEEGVEHTLTTLHSPALFGEATLITRSPRNATVCALEDSHLLVLKHEHLSELVESEHHVASMFMTLMVDRSRPIKKSHITAYRRETNDGQLIMILKNSDNGNYFKLSREGWFVWRKMNGKNTMQEITLALADQYQIFAPAMVAALISKLARSGFIENVALKEIGASGQTSFMKWFGWLRRVLEARKTFGDADRWLTQLYNKGGALLFTRGGKVIMSVLILVGMVAFGFATQDIIPIFHSIRHVWILFVLLIPFAIVSVGLHELGHALTTKSFGQEVHYMGVGWYWLSPVAFTDTSDMWLSKRGPRIAVNMAGIYTDLLVGSLSSLLVLIIPVPTIQAFLWLFALFTFINAFKMLSPMTELDGYYVLMDLFDKPRLRQSAIKWLVKEFPKALRHPALFSKNKPEAYYWVACIIFLILTSCLTLILQSVIFKICGIHSTNLAVSLIIPIIVPVISSLGIIADIREKADEE